MKKEETGQGVIEGTEGGDIGEHTTGAEDEKCSITLRKRKEEIEDKIEAEEFQDSENLKI